jgi:hypothetical protein
MYRKITKLYKVKLRTFIDVKEFDRRECIKKQETITLNYEGADMTMTWIQLQNNVEMISSKKYPSQVGGEDYRLYSYEWNPDFKLN